MKEIGLVRKQTLLVEVEVMSLLRAVAATHHQQKNRYQKRSSSRNNNTTFPE
jgi:hypothetical protein